MNFATRFHNTDEIKEWVNYKTNDDEFTALHFASFRGNL